MPAFADRAEMVAQSPAAFFVVRGLILSIVRRLGLRRAWPALPFNNMPNYVRWRQRGATYFFTVVTYRRRKLFWDASNRRMLKRAMAVIRQEMPFEMFACVLLPDHLHCMWTMPDQDDDFPTRWSRIKRAFSKSFVAAGGLPLPVTENRSRKRGLGVWQPRYLGASSA